MNNFIIGQFGKYSDDKHEREFRKGFWGHEVCLMTDESDLQALNDKREEGVQLGVHFPVKKGLWHLRDPQVLSLDEERRKVSYEFLEQSVIETAPLKPDHILIHYPKPVLLKRDVDYLSRGWWFSDTSEYLYDDEMDFETFKALSKDFFGYYEALGIKYNFKPILELDAIPNYLCQTDLLKELLEEHSSIQLCLDIGRLHIQDQVDESFCPFDFIAKFGAYTSQIHLWNVQVKEKTNHGHYPALPTLDPKEGWADIPKYFKYLNKHIKDYKVVFEHRSDLIDNETLQSCYDWIETLYSEDICDC